MNIASTTSATSATNTSFSIETKKNDSDEFAQLLKKMTGDLSETLRASELKSQAAVMGKGSYQDAVMATLEAEKSLQAGLAIRDKIVSAILEISRMQI